MYSIWQMMLACFVSVVFTVLVCCIIAFVDTIKDLNRKLDEREEYEIHRIPSPPVSISVSAATENLSATGNHAYDHMVTVFARVNNKLGLDMPFSWTADQCEQFRAEQGLRVSRANPDLGLGAEYDYQVDKLVESEMWKWAPTSQEPEMNPCVICSDPAVVFEDGRHWCPEHLVEMRKLKMEQHLNGAQPEPDAMQRMIMGEW